MNLPALKPRARFTVRALLVLMTLLALFFWYHINWIQQRRTAIASGSLAAFEGPGETITSPPGLLRLFGEQGYSRVLVDVSSDEELEPTRLLFPEAEVVAGGWITLPYQR